MKWCVLVFAAAVGACGTDNGGDVLDAGPRADATVTTGDGGPGDPCLASPGCPKPTFGCIHEKILRDMPRCSVCHDPSVGLGLFSVGTASAAAYAVVTGNSAAIGAPHPKRVVPNSPSTSWLYVKLLPNPPVGTQMPQTGPLRQCEIDAVEAWINNGALLD